MLPSSLRGGEKLTTEPIPGITARSPPDTPLLAGIPIYFVNFPAPLYIPQVVMIVTTACTVAELRILSPVEGLIPWLASIAPNLASDYTSTKIEQH